MQSIINYIKDITSDENVVMEIKKLEKNLQDHEERLTEMRKILEQYTKIMENQSKLIEVLIEKSKLIESTNSSQHID
jgi:hypothetical protein